MTTSTLNANAAKNTMMNIARSRHLSVLLLSSCAAINVSPASAATTCPTISNNSTTAQTIAGTTCTVDSGITLNVAGSTAGLTMSLGTLASPATLINNGTITQSGSGRAVQSAGTNAVLVIQNNSGAMLSTANNDTVAAGTGSTTVSSVLLNNAGTILSSAGGQAVNFNKIVNGATNSVVNSGLIKAIGSDAVRPGLNGTVNNSGTIVSIMVSGSSSDGVDAQNNSGVIVTNTAGGLIEGGRHGITGGALNNTVAFTTTVTNNAGATIQGDNGSGINLDGFNALQTATIVNGGTIIGNGITGDGDGIDVDGVVNITNSGIIRSTNAVSSSGVAQSEGITVGGGIIVNSGTIEGLVASGNTNAVGRGITLAGVDTSGSPEHIYANSTITNQSGGLIRGQNDSAIVVAGPASGFTVTINNNAGGTIQGGSATNAAIVTAADNDTINNAGTVNGSSSGKAIDMGAGNNTLNVLGGAVSITGSINGGTGGINVMTINAGSGNSFAYANSISNFSKVEVQSGTATLSGVSTYAGSTVVTGGTLVLSGVNRLSSSSELVLNGGTLAISNATGLDAQTFASLSLTDSSLLELSFARVTFNGLGTVVTGKTLSVLDMYASASPYAFRLLGDYSHDADFLDLIGHTTIDGVAAAFSFDGTYTNVAAVPLPPALAMLLSGLGGLGLFGSRRKRNAAMA